MSLWTLARGSLPEMKILTGKFATTTSGALTGDTSGPGWSVAKSGTGAYTITTKFSSANAPLVQATIGDDGSNDWTAAAGAWSGSARTQIVYVKAAGAAADVSGATVHFALFFKDRSI